MEDVFFFSLCWMQIDNSPEYFCLYVFEAAILSLCFLTLLLPDQICHSPYCQLFNSCIVSSENLVLSQLIIPKSIFSFILITYVADIVRRNSVLVTHGSEKVIMIIIIFQLFCYLSFQHGRK